MELEKHRLENLFDGRMIKRDIPLDLIRFIHQEDREAICKIGLPNGSELEYEFDHPIESDGSQWIIGKFHRGSNINYNPISRSVTAFATNGFLADSVKNLLLQIYEIENFWKNTVVDAPLGAFREHHKEYAKLLEKRLLAIDPELHEKDNNYYWGSMLEDIELGIVG